MSLLSTVPQGERERESVPEDHGCRGPLSALSCDNGKDPQPQHLPCGAAPRSPAWSGPPLAGAAGEGDRGAAPRERTWDPPCCRDRRLPCLPPISTAVRVGRGAGTRERQAGSTAQSVTQGNELDLWKRKHNMILRNGC